MTLHQAITSNLTIEPGQKVNTLGGWCRRDRVLLSGHEIGKLQIRRRQGQSEVITLTDNLYVLGHQVEWLVSLKGESLGLNTTPARNL